uniref:Uncharacterized protein n=1 Tax=Zea mays TaxID=4577 RepID=B7ZXX5_MAIZE|nr:unknown [Zea mays]
MPNCYALLPIHEYLQKLSSLCSSMFVVGQVVMGLPPFFRIYASPASAPPRCGTRDPLSSRSVMTHDSRRTARVGPRGAVQAEVPGRAGGGDVRAHGAQLHHADTRRRRRGRGVDGAGRQEEAGRNHPA